MKVLATDAFRDWYLALREPDADAVTVSVERLEQLGVALSYPHSSEIRGTAIALRELRIAAGRSPLRVFYAFDPKRDAVLLLGGNKSGKKRFYRELIPKVEKIWRNYLEESERKS